MADEEERNEQGKKGLTSRQFMTSMGTAAAIAAVSADAAQARQRGAGAAGLGPEQDHLIGQRASARLVVEPRWSLLYVLRERLSLTGTKVGCERGDAAPARSSSTASPGTPA